MYQRLFIGKKLLHLTEVDSTNVYLKKTLYEHKKEVEGLVVYTENQFLGKGQRGNSWESESGKNLTFSIYLKPNLLVQNQFLISKVISLGIIDFLENLGLESTKIKWPNDVYIGNRKIAGILIENSIKDNKIYDSVVGIGLNVNQVNFNIEGNPTSIVNELGQGVLDLKELLNQLLFFIEKRYVLLKSNNELSTNEDYLKNLYLINESKTFKVNKNKVNGIITGVNSTGKLQLIINERNEEFDLKEIEFLE